MSRTKANIALICLVLSVANACNDEPFTLSQQASGVAPQVDFAGSPGDREAIAQIVATFDQNWGVDAAAYAAQYASATDFVGPDGTILNNAADILQLYQNIFPFFFGTVRHSTIRSLTFFSGTVAVLDLDTRVSGTLPPFVTPWQGNTVRALEKNILMKRGGEWRIVQHQQLLVAPGVGT